MRRRALSRERVVATVVRPLDETTIRVGNDEYVRENRSFGLTTLRERHVEVAGDRIRFRFRGKGGKVHDVNVEDSRVARVISPVRGASRPGSRGVDARRARRNGRAPKKQLVSAIESVAKELGNTPAVCRACYVHPEVMNAHLDGTLRRGFGRKAGKALARNRSRLSPQEAAVLAFLERRLAKSR
jgi:DNA topoisomerase-1